MATRFVAAHKNSFRGNSFRGREKNTFRGQLVTLVAATPTAHPKPNRKILRPKFKPHPPIPCPASPPGRIKIKPYIPSNHYSDQKQFFFIIRVKTSPQPLNMRPSESSRGGRLAIAIVGRQWRSLVVFFSETTF